jgi:Flp pilus assembly protein TadB
MRTHDRPSTADMLWEVLDLGAGLGILILPLFILCLPGLILFFIAPAVALLAVAAIPVALLAALIAPPYLIARAFRRR